MNVYIIDASFVLTALSGTSEKVVIGWKEILTEAVNTKAALYTTSYFSVEVANALRLSYKSIDVVEKSLAVISSLPITPIHLSFIQLSEAVHMAIESKTTVYDSAYHFLALLYKGIFVTCDQEYYKKAKKLGSIELF